MPGPLFGVKYIHNAFRLHLSRTMADIKFWATLGDGDAALMAEKFAMLHESIALHELAEEEVLFPAVNAIEAGKADEYIQAHRTVDDLRDGLLAALRGQNADKAFDFVMEFRPMFNTHLDQEEKELLPWCDEKISVPDQARLAGEMAQKIPPEKFAAFVPWMVRLLPIQDREGVMRMWSLAMPAPVFESVKGLVKGALRDNDWAALVGRVPELS